MSHSQFLSSAYPAGLASWKVTPFLKVTFFLAEVLARSVEVALLVILLTKAVDATTLLVAALMKRLFLK